MKKSIKNLTLGLACLGLLASPVMLAGCLGDKPSKTIESIAVSHEFKTDYLLSDTLDVTDGVLAITYSDGTTGYEVITADMVSNFNSSVPGDNKSLIISYKGKTTVMEYDVNRYFSEGDVWMFSQEEMHTYLWCKEPNTLSVWQSLTQYYTEAQIKENMTNPDITYVFEFSIEGGEYIENATQLTCYDFSTLGFTIDFGFPGYAFTAQRVL